METPFSVQNAQRRQIRGDYRKALFSQADARVHYYRSRSGAPRVLDGMPKGMRALTYGEATDRLLARRAA